MPSLIATLGANIAQFLNELTSAKGAAQKHGEGIASALGEAIGEKLAGIASVVGMEEAIRHTIEYGAHVEDLSRHLGISAEAVQHWDYALKQNGSSIDAAVGFFEKLGIARQKGLAGSEKEIAAFQRLGVSLDDLKSKRVEDIAAEIGHAFEVGDPQALIADLRAIGGKGAGAMVAAFRSGFDELRAEAEKLGLVMSGATTEKFKETADELTRIKTSLMTNLVAPIAEFGIGFFHIVRDIGQHLLALVVAPIVGLFEGIAKFDPSHPFKSTADVARSIVSTTKDAQEGLVLMKMAEEAAAEARKKRLAKGATGEFEETEGEGKGESKLNIEKETEKIRARIEEEKRRGELAELTNTAKILALKKEIAELEAKSAAIPGASQSEDKAKAELDLEVQKRKNELAAAERAEEAEALKKDLADDPRQKPAAHLVNNLQQIGGFLGAYQAAPEVAMLDVQKKSEGHLQVIKGHLQKIAAKTTQTEAGF